MANINNLEPLTEKEFATREAPAATRRPQVGFLGVGWIGMDRLKAIAAADAVEIAAVADLNAEVAQRSAAAIPGAVAVPSFDELLGLHLDGIVIATPTALHAEQSIAALDAGAAVFCQKPLGLNAVETARVIQTARRAERLLGVDMSYRHVRGVKKIKQLIGAGEIGEIFAAELVFHNAYGPDKPWYYLPALSGGGCVIDLGVHLIDLALWMLEFPEVCRVSSRLFADGRRITKGAGVLEDFASVQIDVASGATLNLSCSWHLPAGRDADIRAFFYGSKGALMLRNIKGSFYDFRAQRCAGTALTVLDNAPDAWSGRAAVQWAQQLCGGGRFAPEIETSVQVARVIDAIYDNSMDSIIPAET
jgi:predicted dehydrogenase